MAQFKADQDILTTNDDGPRSPSVPLFVIHTFEGNPNISAVDMAKYQLSPAAGGSYNGVIDRAGMTVRENDDNYIPWAAHPTGNRLGRHWSLAGRASQTRAEWLAQDKQLNALARVLAHDVKEYGTKLIKLSVGEVFRARTDSSVRGVCGHDDISKAFKESDHTDPGPNFPYDVLFQKVKSLLTEPESSNDMSEVTELLKEIKAQNAEILRQLGQPGGWPQGGGRTLYDLAAAIAEVEGVHNTKDTLG